MKKRFYLSDYGFAFATREKGTEIGKYLTDILASLEDNDTLAIDLSGVSALSYSFADELFYRFMEASRLKNDTRKHVVVTGWSDEIIIVLDQTLNRRNYVLAPPTHPSKGKTKERTLICSAATL